MKGGLSPKPAGLMLLAALMHEQSLPRWVRYGDVADMLYAPQEVGLHEYVREFVSKHGKLPDPATCLEDTKVDVTKAPPEPATKYYERVRERYIRVVLTDATKEAQKLLDDKLAGGAEDAMALIQKALVGVRMRDASGGMFDFRNAEDVLWPEYQAKWHEDDEDLGLFTGYPYLDDWGPLSGGEVMSLIGRPSMGKTFQLLFMAHHFWAEQRRPPLIITPEMKPNKILLRLAAMHFGLPIKRLQKGELLPAVAADYQKALHLLKKNNVPFHVVDGKNAQTVEEIRQHARQLGAHAVFIDGAYLLKHPDKRMGRYERVADNMDMIKNDLASDLEVPVVASWQFSREAAKKLKTKKGDEVDLEDIGYSDAIGQHSSVVLGLFETEGVETLVKRKVTVMKGRDGTSGEFHIRWVFDGPQAMDFAQYEEEALEAIEFV